MITAILHTTPFLSCDSPSWFSLGYHKWCISSLLENAMVLTQMVALMQINPKPARSLNPFLINDSEHVIFNEASAKLGAPLLTQKLEWSKVGPLYSSSWALALLSEVLLTSTKSLCCTVLDAACISIDGRSFSHIRSSHEMFWFTGKSCLSHMLHYPCHGGSPSDFICSED